MTSRSNARKPRSFDVESPPEINPEKSETEPTPRPRKPKAAPAQAAKVQVDETDFFVAEAEAELADGVIEVAKPQKPKQGFGLFAVAQWSAGLLITLALGLWFERLWRDALARNDILGWAVAGLIAVFVIAVLGLVLREWFAIRRLARVSDMRERAQSALDEGNASDLRRASADLVAHYGTDPKTAGGRANLQALKGSVLDADDLYALHEKELLTNLDKEAVALVSAAAKRVSVVTAVSPRALVDIGYVLYETIRLIRVVAELYGGRAGTIGTVSLARRVLSHLAVTGTISLGEGVLQQIMGQGLAARISTRLGEGVINGIMTARVGIAAMEVCRPAPFYRLKRPSISDFMPRLLPAKADAENAKSTKAETGD